MTEPKRANRIRRAVGKMRFVTRTKWELPIRGSKPYWRKICEDIESRVVRVRESSVSQSPILYPSVSPSIRSAASGPDINLYDFAKDNITASGFDVSPVEPIVSLCPPSARSPERADRRTVKFLHDPGAEPSSVNPESSNSLRRLERLSRMTKLVNDFLSSTRNRVRPVSALSEIQRSARLESSPIQRSTRERSLDNRSPISDRRRDSPIVPPTPQPSPRESKTEAIGTDEKSVTFASKSFPDDVAEKNRQRFDLVQDAPSLRIGRPRAPSLSVASALPSFGKVVISIEDIDSAEEAEEQSLTEKNHNDLHPKDRPRSLFEDRKPSQDYLRVPEVRTAGHASYPIDDRPKSQIKIDTKMAARLLEKSRIIEESQVLRRKRGFWPRDSLLNVFRAVGAMKHGLRSKARMESETNRFFAVPMEIGSPSGRSSISSDDRADFVCEHEETQKSDEKIGEESEPSYASVRERLMRTAGPRFDNDFQSDGSTGADEAENDSLSFYDDSSGNELRENPPRETKTNASAIDVPNLASVFPRRSADRCLACMCRSLGDRDRSRKPEARGFLEDSAESVSADLPIEDLKIRFSKGTLSPGSHRQFVKNIEFRESMTDDPDAEAPVKVPDSAPISETKALKRTASLVDDPSRPRAIGKSPAKNLVNAKSLASSLSLVSDRSRSISDQDDSDQGCADPSGNEIGMAAGSISKYLAPCHMPVNLRPSLEPLKALRHKKSRSIGSRVASAEKSTDSANDDDDDDDSADDVTSGNLPVRSDTDRGPSKSGGSGQKSATNADLERELRRRMIGNETATERSKIDRNDFRPDEEIINDRDVLEISIKCIGENKNPGEILETLGREYAKRLSEKGCRSNREPNARRNERIAKNLLTLLIDSRRYLNRGKWSNQFNSDLSFSSKQPALTNSRQLRRILPLKSYNLVAPILGMSEWYPRRKNIDRESATKNRRFVRHTPDDSPRKEFSDSAYDLIVHPPSRLGQVSFEKSSEGNPPKLSPYSLFLAKPRRKAVTWRPLTERDLEGYDPEATLKMRATKITDGICEEFCQWLESLAAGTNRTSGIDAEVLKDMFETDFTAEVCRTMQLSINEMPMVPKAVALARHCPGATELARTRRHLVRDAKAEKQPKRLVGFGTALPDRLKFLPPRNRVNEKWLECENVQKDLETMDTVWKGITHLNSVKGFINWLKAHPEVSRPKALENALTSRETLVTRQSQEVVGYELDLDDIKYLKVGDNDPAAD